MAHDQLVLNRRPTAQRGRPYVLGTHAASVLLDHGLGFDAVVRGLVDEVGISAAQATRAAAVASAERAETRGMDQWDGV